jgi:hypothetical protein
MAYVMALVTLALCGSLVACGGGAPDKSAAAGQVSPSSTRATSSGASHAAMAEGRAACKDKPPAQVAEEHLAAARRRDVPSGLTRAGSALAESSSSVKPADAVVASAIYAATVRKSIARDAAAGCSSELRASAPAQRAGAPSRKAATAARRACRSTSPAEVVQRFLPLARRRAGTDPVDRRFLKTAATAPRSLRTSPAYPGIAARVYALSLPESKRQAGLTVCVTQLITKESK